MNRCMIYPRPPGGIFQGRFSRMVFMMSAIVRGGGGGGNGSGLFSCSMADLSSLGGDLGLTGNRERKETRSA